MKNDHLLYFRFPLFSKGAVCLALLVFINSVYLEAQSPAAAAAGGAAVPPANNANPAANAPNNPPHAGTSAAQATPSGASGVPDGLPPTPPTGAPPDINSMVTAPKNLLMGIIERFEYDPAELRDPFLPYNPSKGGAPAQGPVLPLQRFDLEQLKVIAIIWDVADPKAMITDPQGNTNLVRMNERVGRNNGYVAAIREGEVVVVEAFDNAGNISYKTRILKVGGDKKVN